MKKLIALLFLVNLALASPITLEPSKNSQTICLWDTAAIELNVKNVGSQTDTVKLSVDGPEFAVVLPNSVKLNPNQLDKTFVYATPGCFSKTGNYAIRTTAESSTDKKFSDTNLIVTQCVSLQAQPIKACLGDKIDVPLKIKNSAKVSENTYKIVSSLNYQSTVSIKPGEEKTLYAQLDSSKYKAGTYSFKVRATAIYPNTGELTEDYDETSFSVQLESCTNALIDINANGQVCNELETTYPVKITNIGKEGTYAVRIEGLKAAAIKPSQITLKQGETKDLTLSISSGLKPGNYPVKVILENNQNTFSEDKVIQFKNCFDVALSGKADFVCQCQEKGFPIDVINTGAYDDEFYVTYNEGPDFVKPNFDNTPFKLSSNAKKTVSYTAFNCDAAPGKYTAVFKVNSLSGKSGDLLGQEIEVKPKEACYIAEVRTLKEYASPGQSNLIDIAIQNTGLVENTYALSVSGVSWAEFTEEFITIDAGKTKNAVLRAVPPAGSEGQSFNIVLSAVSKDVESKKTIQLISGNAPSTTPSTTIQATPTEEPSSVTGEFTGATLPLIGLIALVAIAGIYLFFKKTDKS
ncbi:LPXTG cell wall anchor domain-containing protein [Candidatus Micrarchaeota archaeon]|nr:LPXTG cell wall anchor domain-containing protein [Candidatus Micrarchaeota archaeon]